MQTNGLILSKSCKSCEASFTSNATDDEIYCKNCRDDFTDNYSTKDFDDIVNVSCRTSPVFYD